MTNKAPMTNDQGTPSSLGHWCLVIDWSLRLGHWSFQSVQDRPLRHVEGSREEAALRARRVPVPLLVELVERVFLLPAVRVGVEDLARLHVGAGQRDVVQRAGDGAQADREVAAPADEGDDGLALAEQLQDAAEARAALALRVGLPAAHRAEQCARARAHFEARDQV